MTFAVDMQAVAASLLSEFGQVLTFTRNTNTIYNPATGGVDAVSSATYSGYGHPSFYSLAETDGTLVQTNDVRLLVYSTTAPTQQDTVLLDSIVYQILTVQKVNAQGSTIVYRLQLRV